MSIDAKHPSYADKEPAWNQLRDTYKGERKVKSEGTKYLPATAGMIADGLGTNQPGAAAYKAYLTRAVFPDIVKEAVEGMVGIMHRESPNIELPKKLEPLRQAATDQGEPLNLLLRKINEAQLLFGRIGLLAEVPDGADVASALPFIVPFRALQIINWSTGEFAKGRMMLEFIVLDESGMKLTPEFQYEHKEEFRFLTILDDKNEIGDVYRSGVLSKNDVINLDKSKLETPSVGGKTFSRIPFVFINSADLVPDPDEPPLEGMSDLALAIYRGEADFRQALFQQAQETLVIIGREPQAPGANGEETRVGAGTVLDLPIDGNAKYIGVSAEGLEVMAKSIEDDKAAAANKGARLLQTSEGDRQSGDALRIRVAASTATLATIAKTSASALEDMLKMIAEWTGANPDEVKVEANTDFTEDVITGKDLLDLMSSKMAGAPLSNKSIHRYMQKRDLTTMTFEDELTEIENEEPILGTDNQPEEDDNDVDDPENI